MKNQEAHHAILEQLGGNKFLVMTGSHHLMFSKVENNFLSMHLRRNIAKAQFLKIILQANDTYKMIFSKVTGKKYEQKLVTVKEFEGVYCDQLQAIFTQVTGLYTSLGTMGRKS